MAFSPDGRTLASGSRDKTIRLWDVETGQPQATLKGHENRVNAVAFSPDGRTLASGGGTDGDSWSSVYKKMLVDGDKTIRLWDVKTGLLRTTLEGHENRVNAVAFSPDGRTLASGSRDKTIRLWDVETGLLRTTLKGHRDRVNSVAFSPDGTTLVSGSGTDGGKDKTIRMWDMGQLPAIPAILKRHTILEDKDGVNVVAFSPDGRTLASGSWDKTVRVWDVETGLLRATLKGHTGVVFSVAFSPDGRTLASGGGNGTIQLWEASSGQPKAILKGHTRYVSRATLKGHTGVVFSVAFSPDGRTLASGGGNGTIQLWEASSGQPKAILKGHTRYVSSVAFSPDGRALASGCLGGPVQLWNVGHNQPTNLSGPKEYVNSVAFSPDGSFLARDGYGVDADGHSHPAILLWDVGTDQRPGTLTQSWDAVNPLKAVLTGHTSPVTSVAFSPDGTTLASGSGDKTIRLWDVGTGQLQTILRGHTGVIKSVAFSPDGSTLASGSWDKTIRLWNVGRD